MALPTPNSDLMTPEWTLAFNQYASNDAWYSDDQQKLLDVYQAGGNGSSRGDDPATHYNKGDGTRRTGGVRGFLAKFFNGRIVSADQQRTRIHAPVASNLATLSSDLLTAEPPSFRLVDADGKSYKGKATDRLDAILNGPETHRTMSHAAELTAGLSATILTAHWDKSISDKPWVQASSCDAAFPEFRGGRLSAVNLYTSHILNPGPVASDVFVHIERHEPGAVIHALFRTKLDQQGRQGFGALGELVPLETVDALSHIPNIPGSMRGAMPNTIILPTGITRLTAAWWRNLPTKTFRRYGGLQQIGRADFEGVEQMLDAVDEVWSSWMRDIKIARARLIVPETFLDVQGPGLGGAFDDDAEILTALAFTDLGPDQGKIHAHQFEIRYREHQGTLLSLTKEITQFAGYSLSSYGERSDAGTVTATEITDRTTMTERTRDKKFLYFVEAADPLAMALMDLDARHYGGQAIPSDATLEIRIPEISQVDPEKEARVFQYLRSAMAASTSTLVRAQHPDWDEPELLAEIDRVKAENNLNDEIDAALNERVDPDKLGPDGEPIITRFDDDLDDQDAA